MYSCSVLSTIELQGASAELPLDQTMMKFAQLITLFLSISMVSSFSITGMRPVGRGTSLDLRATQFSVTGALQPGTVTDISGEQLDQELTSHDTPILLDVYATWCGPCKVMAPELEKVAQELGSKCRVVKMDSDENPEHSDRYQVRGLPTILLLEKGIEKVRMEGAYPKDKIREAIEHFIDY